MIGCATGTICNIWSAIEDRHHRYGYTLLLGMQGDSTRMSKVVAAVRGQPSCFIFPVGSHHVRALLELAGLSDIQTRDMLICVLGTTARMRVGGGGADPDLRPPLGSRLRLAPTVQQHAGCEDLQTQASSGAQGSLPTRRRRASLAPTQPHGAAGVGGLRRLLQDTQSRPWAPASPQMTDRALAGSQLAQTASVELLKGFLNI